MTGDIFEFWRDVPGHIKVHPQDEPIFARLSRTSADGPGHETDLRCIPAPFFGPLRTAPVVLLFLGAGWQDQDWQEADDPVAQQRQVDQRSGLAPVPRPAEHPSGWRWWSQRTRLFGDLSRFRDRIAFLNICGYHAPSFTAPDYRLLRDLPSCRVARDWAKAVLFPAAEAGDRVVVCLRSAKYWDLEPGRAYNGTLFAPQVVRGGHMRKAGEHGAMRETVVRTVRAALGLSPELV